MSTPGPAQTGPNPDVFLLEVSHSPEEDEVALSLTAGTRFEGVHLAEDAAERIRNGLAARR